MAAEHWFRWHHGTVNDPKWRVIASRCVTNVTVGHVVAVWAAMMENASLASPRGELDGWNDEDVAAGYGFATEQVKAIREAMQGKVLNKDVLTAWNKRQPKREDRAADRTKAWRERNALAGDAPLRNVTQCDAALRSVTLETETETEIKASTLSSGDDAKSKVIPEEQILAAYHTHCPMMPAVRKMTDPRKRKLKARWLESPECQTLEYWDRFFTYAAKSDFLTGRNGAWTGCDFEWLVEKSNHVKVIEGKYENRAPA